MQSAPIKEPIADKSGFATQIWIRWLQLVSQVMGYSISESIRITTADSPYSAAAGVNLVCDTDGGSIAVNFPVGVQGVPIRLVNAGTSGNGVTVDGNGTEKIKGALTQTVTDGQVLDTRYDSTEGWW